MEDVRCDAPIVENARNARILRREESREEMFRADIGVMELVGEEIGAAQDVLERRREGERACGRERFAARFFLETELGQGLFFKADIFELSPKGRKLLLSMCKEKKELKERFSYFRNLFAGILGQEKMDIFNLILEIKETSITKSKKGEVKRILQNCLSKLKKIE